MSAAKEIEVHPIKSEIARRIIKKLHYSNKVTQNSQLHFGVFLKGRLEGAMQFGPSMDKRRMQGLVAGTKFNEFLELNRMAFSEALPKNSESRALAVAMRIIRRRYPQIGWVISFADATQCGDGCIYRASGFVLTGIKRNTTMLRMPDGSIVADKTLNLNLVKKAGWWKARGATPLKGFQLRYIYFLRPEMRRALTVPIIPFSEIAARGAEMYKGVSKRAKQAMAGDQPVQRQGGTDPHAPQSPAEC
jgi:hypothetical protein